MKFFKLFIFLNLVWGFLFIFTHRLLAQNQDEEVLKLKEEKITDLEINKSEVNRKYNYLTNTDNKKENLFDREMTLGLLEKKQGSDTQSFSPWGNYFRINAGNGYYFIGEFNYTQILNQDLEDWLKISFIGLSHQKLTSLLGESIDNSKRYRFDVGMSYQFSKKSKAGNSYLHSFEGSHTSYHIGLQDFNTTNDKLIYYHFHLEYSGYYLFNSWVLDHSYLIGGGKYDTTLFDNRNGFIETSYDLEIKGVDGKTRGLFSDFAIDFDWLNFGDGQNQSGYRFLFGFGIGYNWDINDSWILNLYLGHVSEVIKGSNSTEVDPFLPVVVLPKVGFTFLFDPQIRLDFEAAIKTETENLWQLYGREALYRQGIFPYLHRLAEGKIAFIYDALQAGSMLIETFVLYNYFFKYDRAYYTPNQLKSLTEEEGISRASLGLKLDISITKWLALKQKLAFNINFPIDQLLFPFVKSKSKLIFSVSKIHSRFFIGYLISIAEIYSQNKQESWELPQQRFDLGCEFEYRHLALQLSLENIFNNVNYHEIPDLEESGFSIVGGIKYSF